MDKDKKVIRDQIVTFLKELTVLNYGFKRDLEVLSDALDGDDYADVNYRGKGYRIEISTRDKL